VEPRGPRRGLQGIEGLGAAIRRRVEHGNARPYSPIGIFVIITPATLGQMAKRTFPHAEVQLLPDAEERFLRAVQGLKRTPIHHQNGKLIGADRPKTGRGRPRKNEGSS
jgi:hypothetical protein